MLPKNIRVPLERDELFADIGTLPLPSGPVMVVELSAYAPRRMAFSVELTPQAARDLAAVLLAQADALAPKGKGGATA